MARAAYRRGGSPRGSGGTFLNSTSGFTQPGSSSKLIGAGRERRLSTDAATSLPAVATPLCCAPWSRRQRLSALPAPVGGRLIRRAVMPQNMAKESC